MEKLPSVFNLFSGLLSKPGDSFMAKISKSGNQIIKLSKDGLKKSVVRYPGTGTIVETIVHRIRK